MKKKVFISFDYDNDNNIKGSLIAQSKQDDSPFEIIDMSLEETITEKWKQEARRRIRKCDCMIVLCGRYTDTAKGVTAELSIAQEERIPYFLLCGRRDGKVKKPLGAKRTDDIYKWKWNNIKSLLEGER